MDSQRSADDVRPLLRQAAAIADFDDDGRWAIIGELRRRTDRIAFDAVCELAGSTDVRERVAALDVLGQALSRLRDPRRGRRSAQPARHRGAHRAVR